MPKWPWLVIVYEAALEVVTDDNEQVRKEAEDTATQLSALLELPFSSSEGL